VTREILLVSHFHWDREWYRTFEAFRARLVDAIDAVLDQLAVDPGFRFVLDGQAIVLEDYLAIRPERRDALIAGLRDGRLAAGPWYVQPDSFLPHGETHVRNLLHGRAVAGALGPVSTAAYVPDSFGHPAQLPQLFAGFGLDPFVYWRGNGNELDALGPLYTWRAPDGSKVRAWHLSEGYFGAGGLDADGDVALTAKRVQDLIGRLEAAGLPAGAPVLLMNGFDHLPADTTTAAVAGAAGAQRVLLDDAAGRLPAFDTDHVFTGALDGGRITNLLPGVWSTRMPLKLRNRTIETLLTAWAEPWVAFAHQAGLPDERPALTLAWRTLLCNQAHDSICGCSIDPVHERMEARNDDAEGLARATVQRTLERLAGRSLTRATPWQPEQGITVFNASPQPRTGVVRVPLEGFPPWRISVTRFDINPLSMPEFSGVTIDGQPARLVPSDDPNRVRFLPGVGGLDVEFVATDVPAFGARTYSCMPAEPVNDTVDDGRKITAGDVNVHVDDDGTFAVTLGDRTYPGCFGVEDSIDRGDTYDADPDPPRPPCITHTVERTRHPSGIERLRVDYAMEEIGTATITATVAPGVPFVSFGVALDNRATDHRLRLRFPTGAPVDTFAAATMFDAAHRSTSPRDDTGWIHPAPRTFAHQGWIAANGLVVGAPGLPEAQVTASGDILVTLVRSVGVIARMQLRTRPMPAAPEMPAPGAQVLGTVKATITLALSSRDARAGEVGLWGVLAGELPNRAPTSFLTVTAQESELSACKPAEDGDGIIVRVLNPSDIDETVTLTFAEALGVAATVRLDETPSGEPVERDGRTVRLDVPAHALRSVRVRGHRDDARR
jgi:hypothetical protein